MKKNLILFAALTVILTAPGISAFAQEQAGGQMPAHKMPAGMDEAKMAEMKLKASPNENHKVLDPLVGEWDYTVGWRMNPEDPLQESTGTTNNKWVMDGRFLQQETKGQMMGETFEGLGFTGYDNIKEEYNSVWMDNMGTGMMMSSGKYDTASKTISETGSFSCPLTGEKNMAYRAEWKITDPDHFTYTMYRKAPDGQEFKGMEVNYTHKA